MTAALDEERRRSSVRARRRRISDLNRETLGRAVDSEDTGDWEMAIEASASNTVSTCVAEWREAVRVRDTRIKELERSLKARDALIKVVRADNARTREQVRRLLEGGRGAKE